MALTSNRIDQVVHPRSAYPDMGFTRAATAGVTPGTDLGALWGDQAKPRTPARRSFEAYRIHWNVAGGAQPVTMRPLVELQATRMPPRPWLSTRRIWLDDTAWKSASYVAGKHDAAAWDHQRSFRSTVAPTLSRQHVWLDDLGWVKTGSTPAAPGYTPATDFASTSLYGSRTRLRPLDYRWLVRQPLGAAGPSQQPLRVDIDDLRSLSRRWPALYTLNLGRMNAAIAFGTGQVWPVLDFLRRSDRPTRRRDDRPRQGDHAYGWHQLAVTQPFDPQLGAAATEFQRFVYRARARGGTPDGQMGHWPAFCFGWDSHTGAWDEISLSYPTWDDFCSPPVNLRYVAPSSALWNAFRLRARALSIPEGDMNLTALISFSSPFDPTRFIGNDQLWHSFRARAMDRSNRPGDDQIGWLGQLIASQLAESALLMAPNAMLQTVRTHKLLDWRPVDTTPISVSLPEAISSSLGIFSPEWLKSFRLPGRDQAPRFSDAVGWWQSAVPLIAFNVEFWAALESLWHTFRSRVRGGRPSGELERSLLLIAAAPPSVVRSWALDALRMPMRQRELLGVLSPSLTVAAPAVIPSIACYAVETDTTDADCDAISTTATDLDCAGVETIATTPDCPGTPPVGIL